MIRSLLISLFIAGCLLHHGLVAQNCVTGTSFTVNPQPTNSTYAPGTVVTYCFTVNGYTQNGTNWFEGFDINLGPGWVPGSVTPVSAPSNCTAGGQWIWLNSSTSTATPVQTFGPGYFFDLDNDGIAGDDFGDMGSCVWTMCFSVTVGNVPGTPLTMQVAPLSDGVAGAWNSTACDGVNYSTLTPSSVVVGQPCNITGAITSSTNIFCFGASTGSVTVAPSSGNAPFTYTINGGAPQANGTFNNLAAGNYTIVITDATLCNVTIPVTLTQPPFGMMAQVVNFDHVDCNGQATGSFQVTGLLGMAPFQYTINGTPGPATGIFNNLTAGNYAVVVTDASGCTAQVNHLVTQPSVLSIAPANLVQVSCFGGNNGQIQVIGAGGTAPYTYSINTGAAPVGGNTFTNLSAATYTLVVTDANNCTASANYNLTQPPSAVSLSAQALVPVTCFNGNDGSFTLGGSGGVPPYLFSVNGSPGGAATSFSSLTAGNYQALITDANACTAQITVTVTQPPLSLAVSILGQGAVSCFGGSDGSTSLNATGGTAPYTYSIPGNNNSTGVFTNLTAGNYVAQVSDANGCATTFNFTVSQPANPLSVQLLNQTNVSCFGTATGELTVSGNGGTPTYQYAILGTTPQTSPTFQLLTANLYTIEVTDMNSCTATVQVNITQPAQPIAVNLVSVTNVLCFGGNTGVVVVDAPGGTQPVTFQLGPVNNQTGSFNNLLAGNFTVLATDANGCISSASGVINQPAAPLAVSILNQTNATCSGYSDGTASVLASGGTAAAAYQYAWNTVPAQVGATANGLAAGSYSVVVSDDNACTATLSVNIAEPNFQINGINNVTFCSGDPVQIFVSSLDGAAPVAYTFTDLTNGGVYTGNPWNCTLTTSAGIQVNAIDNNGCIAPSTNFSITVNPSPVADFIVDKTEGCIPFCPTFNFTGVAMPGMQYKWSFSDGSSASGQVFTECFSRTGLLDVSLQVITPAGCSDLRNDSALLEVFLPPTVAFTVENPSMTTEDPEVELVNRSDPSLNFEWNMGDQSPELTYFRPQFKYAAPGAYCIELVGTDARGCKAVDEQCVEVINPYRLFLPTAFTPDGDSRNDEFKAYGQEFKRQHMRIFDRWGGLIFEDQGEKTISWRADNVPNGVYTYLLIVLDNIGNTQRYTGTVTVLR